MENYPQSNPSKKILLTTTILIALAGCAFFASRLLKRENDPVSIQKTGLDQDITSSSGQETEETPEKVEDIMPDSSEYRATEPSAAEDDASQDDADMGFVDDRVGIAFSFPDNDSVRMCTPERCADLGSDSPTYFISSPDGSRTYLSIKPKSEDISLEKFLAQEYKFDGLILDSYQNSQGTQIVRPGEKQSARYYEEFGKLGSGIEYHHFIAAGKEKIAYAFHDQSHGSNPETVKMLEDTIRLK
jgi:hypothetical protein